MTTSSAVEQVHGNGIENRNENDQSTECVSQSGHRWPLRAVLFDIDGTMCDTDPFHSQVFRNILKDFNIDCTEEYYAKNISGHSNENLRAELFPQLPLEESTAILVEKERQFRVLAGEKLEPLNGLRSLLKTLKENNIHIAAVTNAPRPNVEMIFDRFGFATPPYQEYDVSSHLATQTSIPADFKPRVFGIGRNGSSGWFTDFECIIVGGEGECIHSKPHPLPYQLAMKYLNVQPDECCVFEDSRSGIKAGKAAGVRTIGIMTTLSREEVLQLGGDDAIEDYTQLDIEKFIRNEPVVTKTTS